MLYVLLRVREPPSTAGSIGARLREEMVRPILRGVSRGRRRTRGVWSPTNAGVDWADAKACLGRNPLDRELGRTGAQRRVDALVEMARRAGTTPKSGQRPAPLFTILVGVDAFAKTCELAAGTILTPGAAARWVE